jgi:hypothetical protein
LLHMLSDRITTMLKPPSTPSTDLIRKEAEQGVINKSPIITIPHITDAPGIIVSHNPTAKRALKAMPRTHRQVTRNNTPGIMPTIVTPAAYGPIPRGVRQ